jgi:hypothetical protein|tara:strand:+ start:216 stop:530 length:315 start_codon:yes stop_codon:yes gene_type:complete
MDVITFEKNAYLTLIKKIDEIYQELQRLKDPAYHFSKEYIDSYAVLDILHISRRTLTKYTSSGKLPYVRIDHKNYFKLEDIRNFMESNYGVHPTSKIGKAHGVK